MSETKTCRVCDGVFPKTQDYFPRYYSTPHKTHYFESRCKPCKKIKMAGLYKKVPRFQCGCGAIISKRTLKVHIKSKKHQKYLAMG